jgi:hypothetical protein
MGLRRSTPTLGNGQDSEKDLGTKGKTASAKEVLPPLGLRNGSSLLVCNAFLRACPIGLITNILWLVKLVSPAILKKIKNRRADPNRFTAHYELLPASLNMSQPRP